MLKVSGIHKKYNGKAAVENVSFSLDENSILCLLGPSGCGKTTLLKIIAGLETPDAGKVFFSRHDITFVPPYKRNFGMMFQEFALFPHKDVFHNVSFGLEMKNKDKKASKARVEEVLEIVGLKGFEKRKVHELSGGERQRVALARSLAPRPGLLMLDEPLGSLDRALRERLTLDLMHILKDVGISAIFVTHDQAEAFTIADKIVVLKDGKIEQEDTPENLYKEPSKKSVADFLGFHNFIEGKAEEDGRVNTGLGKFYPSNRKVKPGRKVTLLLRPENAKIAEKNQKNLPVVEGVVKECVFQGPFYRLAIKVKTGRTMIFYITNSSLKPRKGEKIKISIDSLSVVGIF